MTVKYAIIGSGMMGQEHIRNISLLPDARVVAIAEPDAEMRAASQTLLGTGLEAFDSHTELIAKTDADAFVVATPNFTHAGILEDLIVDGRPVLIEKPVITDLEQGRRLADRIQGARGPIWVAMEYRFMPGVSRLVADVHAGATGDLKMVSIVERRYPFLSKVGNWNRFNRYSGGTLVEKCCHFFDLMRLLVRSEPVRIHAVGGQAINHLDENYAGETPDILDNCFVTVEFANGVNSLLELCMFAEGSHFQERISAVGTKALLEARVPRPGRFEADGVHKDAQYVVAERASKLETIETVKVDPRLLAAGDHHGSTFHQHLLFNKLVREGGEPAVTVQDGMKAVAMGIAAQTSIAEKRIVDLTTMNPFSAFS